MKRWVMAYETDDPDPAAGKVREDITAHAYDQREHRPVHSITNTYRKWAKLHLMHHSAGCVNTRCLRRSVRPCGALGLPGRRAAAVTWDFTGGLDLMQR